MVNRHAVELLWDSLAEPYAEGGCEMHLYFCAGFVQGREAGDWCKIFDRPVDHLDLVVCNAFNPVETGGGPEKRNMG